MVSLGAKEVLFQVNLRLHPVRGDGSCALYCLLQAAKDAESSHTFWKRLLTLEDERPLLVRGMRKLVELSKTDGVGCPMLRLTLCKYMLERAADPLQGLWNSPPAPEALEAGWQVATRQGLVCDKPSQDSQPWTQHAVAFLAPNQLFDEHYQKVLMAFLDDGLAIATIQHQPHQYHCEQHTNRAHVTRRYEGPQAGSSGRVYIHFRRLVQEGTQRALILWPMFLEHPEDDESSDRNHYQHTRASDAPEPTSLVFIEDLSLIHI